MLRCQIKPHSDVLVLDPVVDVAIGAFGSVEGLATFLDGIIGQLGR